MSRLTLFKEISDERDRQDAKWGGPAHDDEHAPEDWDDLIVERLYGADQEHRRLMVQVAAIAVAAIEAMDRRNARESDQAELQGAQP